MLELFPVPKIDDENVIFQQGGTSGHYANTVTEFLHETFPRRWIGKKWPPRFLDLTTWIFISGGNSKVKLSLCSTN
jgi:hypothetical protein